MGVTCMGQVWDPQSSCYAVQLWVLICLNSIPLINLDLPVCFRHCIPHNSALSTRPTTECLRKEQLQYEIYFLLGWRQVCMSTILLNKSREWIQSRPMPIISYSDKTLERRAIEEIQYKSYTSVNCDSHSFDRESQRHSEWCLIVQTIGKCTGYGEYGCF